MIRIPFEKIPTALLGCMHSSEQYLNELNIIDKSFMDILKYRVSVLNRCAFCIEMHFKEAIASGESELRVYSSAVWQQTSFYNPREQALLAWAESVTLLKETPDQKDVLYSELNKHFTQAEVANLTFAFVQINLWNRLASQFGFEAGLYKVGQFK